MKLRVWSLAALAVLSSAPRAHAACNLIPSASHTFRGTLGDLNRPFAAPGDFVEIGASPSRCAGASPGIGAAPDDQIVTVVFKPPANGTRRVAFTTTLPCGSPSVTAKVAACEAIVGAGNVSCIQSDAGTLNMDVVDRNGERRLDFRFPDTDALLPPDADDRTASGPATIAVTPAGADLPCGLATTTCASQTGAIACIDALYAADGTCNPTPDPVFPGFTALPQPNDFQADCFTDTPPCTGLANETRLAVDGAGNLFLPVHWRGVLIRQNGVPVPRLIRATIKSPLPFPVPDAAFLASYTPEGAKLPPIFEPQADPTIRDPNVVTLFGSADASYTILRFARRAGRCAGGTNDGQQCSVDLQCPGGSCPTTCVGGGNADAVCTADAQCSGGQCGTLFADFRPAMAQGGPLPLRRQAAGACLLPPHASCAAPADCPSTGDLCVGAGICQLAPHATCAGNADCPADGDACVSYAFEASTAIPLESLNAGTKDVFSFSVNESTRLSDDDGDGDSLDSVVTLRDRATGAVQPMGSPAGCSGVNGATATGRAVVRISDAPFSYPAVESEGDVVAFLESESAEGHCDQTADTDRSDAIVRAFALGSGERTSTLVPPHVADTALSVNGRALAISNGLVFYRRPERGTAAVSTVRQSVGPGGVEPNAPIEISSAGTIGLSADGRYSLFISGASNLIPGDTNAAQDVFLRDNLSGTTERANAVSTASFGGGGARAAISGDGRYVAWDTGLSDIVPDDNNLQADVFVRDRVLGTVERVSVQSDGTEASGGNGGFYATYTDAISRDGRYVLFGTEFDNLVPNDTNGNFDLFVHDRVTGGTERVDVRSDGSELSGGLFFGIFNGAMSADGRYVVFATHVRDVVPNDNNLSEDVFVRDRLLGTTERVSVASDGSEGPSFTHSGQGSLGISDDGRFVLFTSDVAFVPQDTNGATDFYVHDRVTGITELVSVATGGVVLPTGGGSAGAISGDGRFVAFTADDAAHAVPGDDNGVRDVFVYDRQSATTERVSVGPNATQAVGGDSFMPALSYDGSTIAFASDATNLVAGDTDGFTDTFVRRPDLTAPGLDLFPNGVVGDTLLEVFDTASQTATLLCPADQVAVAAGRTAFLRPESSIGTPGCPGGSLNGDADVGDDVVQLWQPGGPVQNLGLAATQVAMSDTHIAALASEAGQNATDSNGDGDTADEVVEVRPVGGNAWANVGQAADALAVCGTHVPFITPEAAQNADLDGDGVQTGRILQIWNAAGAGSLVNTALGAEEFVCGDTLIAFRSPEHAAGAHRNGDGDDTDDVLTIYDMTTGTVHETGQAVTPCRLAECDARLPYRVLGRTVKFLTLEAEQGNTDLNGDGDANDLVIQTFDVDSNRTTVIGTVRDGADPFTDGAQSAIVYASSGHCVEFTTQFCGSDDQCAQPTYFCENSYCGRETGVCVTSADCAPGSTCTPGGIVPASPDTDGDGVPDHLDNCPYTGPADQTDSDGDGVGDLCDLATCGNGVTEATEICDGADANACPGACLPDCTCGAAVCGNGVKEATEACDRTDDGACPGNCLANCTCCPTVADPKAAVSVKTVKGAGVLKLKWSMPLDAYVDAPVTVRLLDRDTDPIVEQMLGGLPPKGKSGKQWAFKTKADGVQQVALKSQAPKLPGTFQLIVGAKKWFTAAQANQSAADSTVRVTIGDRCWSHAVTKKKD